jgi:hypothetical protein
MGSQKELHPREGEGGRSSEAQRLTEKAGEERGKRERDTGVNGTQTARWLL